MPTVVPTLLRSLGTPCPSEDDAVGFPELRCFFPLSMGVKELVLRYHPGRAQETIQVVGIQPGLGELKALPIVYSSSP